VIALQCSDFVLFSDVEHVFRKAFPRRKYQYRYLLSAIRFARSYSDFIPKAGEGEMVRLGLFTEFTNQGPPATPSSATAGRRPTSRRPTLIRRLSFTGMRRQPRGRKRGTTFTATNRIGERSCRPLTSIWETWSSRRWSCLEGLTMAA
jgi:hypothetical protein